MNIAQPCNKLFRISIDGRPSNRTNFISNSMVSGNRGAIKENIKITARYVVVDKEYCGKVYLVVTAAHTNDKYEYIPSRYAVQKCIRYPKSNPSETNNFNPELFKVEMKKTQKNKFEYELKDIFIFAPYETRTNAKFENLYKDAVCETQYKKYLQLVHGYTQMDLRTNYSDIKDKCYESCTNDYINRVHLAFDVLAERDGKIIKAAETLYTNEIKNAAEGGFRIERLCNTHVLNTGNSEITLLLSAYMDIEEILILEKGKETNAKCTLSQRVVKAWKKNNAISFVAPHKNCPPDALTVPCVMSLKTKKEFKAKSVQFYYVNSKYQKEQVKRMCREHNNYFGQGPPDDDDSDSFQRHVEFYIQAKNNNNSGTSKNNQQSNSPPRHESMSAQRTTYYKEHFRAVESGRLEEFLNIRWRLLNKYLALVMNDKFQTLLHYACELNRYRYIRPLIDIGCPLAAPCVETYETALHIAIKHGHFECINEFRKIIENGAGQRNIVAMLTHYDSRGYTVVHAAAENGLVDLMRAIFRFCDYQQFDILNMPTLTLEYTLLELATQYDMKTLINRELEKCNRRNRNGRRPGDDDDDGHSGGVSIPIAFHRTSYDCRDEGDFNRYRAMDSRDSLGMVAANCIARLLIRPK